MVKNLMGGLTESALNEMDEKKVCNLARSLLGLQANNQRDDLTEYLDMAKKVYLKKYNWRKQRKEVNEEEPEQIISKENIAVREALKELGIEFQEEELLQDVLYKPDFFIPSLNMAVEINGISHFYPYSSRFNNFSNTKNKILKSHGYGIVHLNAWKLEGLLKYNNAAGLKEFLAKSIESGKLRMAPRTEN